MPEQWTADFIGEMHVKDLTHIITERGSILENAVKLGAVVPG